MSGKTSESRPIIGFEGRYTISKEGMVYSVKNGIYRKPVLYNNGYYCVMLKSKGKRSHRLIHRLVAQAFIENPDNKTTVNHIDGDKLNNHVSNLEWMTLRENIKHGYANGLLKPNTPPKGIKNHRSIFSAEDIKGIKTMRADGYTYAQIAKQYNCHLATIAANDFFW